MLQLLYSAAGYSNGSSGKQQRSWALTTTVAMSGVSVASRRRALGGSGGSVQGGDESAAALVESADVPADELGSLCMRR